MLSKLAHSVITQRLIRVAYANFSGTHREKPFDWRDDHDLNPLY